MKQHLACVALLALALFAPVPSRADYPKPSPYPTTWQFDFTYGTPRRIVLDIPGQSVPQAYWYITYTVTNNTDEERTFLPVFEILTKEGKVVRSDKNIPAKVFDYIKGREKKQFLESFPKIAGPLRIGEDQAKEGVAIWPEPAAEMGQFSVFVSGLSGEIAPLTDAKGEQLKGADGNPVILQKTLQLNYIIRGDEVSPGEDEINENPKEWVMR